MGARIDRVQAKLKIEKLVYGGAGLARHAGLAVLVPYVLPGEELEVALSQPGKGVLHGRPLEWETLATDREEPSCPVFGQCGGCHYQHAPYERECQLKEEILRETLRRVGGLRWDGPVEVVAAEPWAYRNRTQLRLFWRGRDPQIGFFAAGSRRHVATSLCPINSPKLNDLQADLLAMAADRRFPRSLRAVEFFTNEDRVQMSVLECSRPLPKRFLSWCAERLDGHCGSAPLDYRCGADVFRVSSHSFFQVNRYLVDRLADLVVGQSRGDLALDLYCGVGLLTLPLARRFQSVIAIDSGATAMRDLQYNVRRAGLAVRAVQMRVREFLEGLEERPDLVVADPPRAGLGGAAVEQLTRLQPPRLHLVSCDPATLARDLKLLVAGGYRVESVTMIDLFPQTFHIETVVVLLLR